MLELISKILSVLPFYYFIFLGIINAYLFATNILIFKRLFLYTLGIISATIFSEMIKKCIKPVGILKNIWYRPKGAKGCDYLSIKGFAPDFTPGFPSGHMSTTSYFTFYNMYLLNKYWKPSLSRNIVILCNNKNTFMVVVNFIYSVFVPYSVDICMYVICIYRIIYIYILFYPIFIFAI